MVDHNLIADLGIDMAQADALILEALGAEAAAGDLDAMNLADIQAYKPGNILKGIIVGKAGDDAVIDVGLKSEGLVHKSEFDDWDTLESGTEVEVVLEEIEDENGIVKLSKSSRLPECLASLKLF